jgi:tRNA threonylcarbamoyladenosine biosynthesis protein TsaE
MTIVQLSMSEKSNFLRQQHTPCPFSVVTHSAWGTQQLGKRVAVSLRPQKTGAVVVALHGELGSGKTQFVKGFARGLGVRERIVSPTFILMRVFLLPHTAAFRRLVHIDAYRIRRAHELKELGWNALTADRRTVVILDWAENVKRILPYPHLHIELSVTGEKEREVTIENNHQ